MRSPLSENHNIIDGFEIIIVLKNGRETMIDGILTYIEALQFLEPYFGNNFASQAVIYNAEVETYKPFNSLEEINNEIEKLQKLSETTIDWMRPR